MHTQHHPLQNLLSIWLVLGCVGLFLVSATTAHAQDQTPETPQQPTPSKSPTQGDKTKNAKKDPPETPQHPQTQTQRRKGPGPKAGQPRPDPNTLTEPIDPYDWQRENGTVPMWTNNLDRMAVAILRLDLGFAFGGTPPDNPNADADDAQRLNFDARILDMAMPLSRDYRFHDRLLSIRIQAVRVWSMPGLGSIGPGQGTRALIDFENAFMHALGLGLRFDSKWVGVEGGFHTLNADVDEEFYWITPFAGLRVGKLDAPILSIRARFPQLFVFASTDIAPSLTRQILIEASAELPLPKKLHFLRPQLRGFYRDIAIPDRPEPFFDRGRHLKDAGVVLGAEFAGDLGMRFFPAFLGLGVRQVDLAQARLGDFNGTDAQPVTIAPTDLQVFLHLSVDMGLYGTTSVW